MRYTTIVDITENPSLYRNKNCRLVYLHLCLKSGYHNEDRDLIDISIRNLAWAVGLSVSATRHALSLLESARMIKRHNQLWHVRKFVLEQEITPREKTVKGQKKAQEARIQRAQNEALSAKLDEERERRMKLQDSHTSDFIIYYENQVKKAKDGDIDAQGTIRKRRELYLQDCKNCGHTPVAI